MKKMFAVAVGAAALVAAGCGSSSNSSTASNCPGPGGTVRFGVEPYDSSPAFLPAYKSLAAAVSKNLGCQMKLIVASSYTAEIEAMRAKQLEIGEFGPLGYVFANRLANAQPVAAFGDSSGNPVTYTAAIWVPKSSPITSVAQLKGKTIALSDPASTSGSLYPKFALMSAGLDPSQVTIKYAGGHTASMLALVNGKVDAGELNSQQRATAVAAGQFKPAQFRRIWTSTPIENDPITVRGDLPAAFKQRVAAAFTKLTPAQVGAIDKELGVGSGPVVAASDSLYQGIRDVADKEHLDMSALK